MEEKFIYRRVGVVRHTGEIVYVVSVHTKSACEPNYESYPFGMQLCSLKFGSWVNGQGGSHGNLQIGRISACPESRI